MTTQQSNTTETRLFLTVEDCLFAWACGIRADGGVDEERVQFESTDGAVHEVPRVRLLQALEIDPDLRLMDAPPPEYIEAQVSRLRHIGDVRMLLNWCEGSPESDGDAPYLLLGLHNDVDSDDVPVDVLEPLLRDRLDALKTRRRRRA